MGGELAGGGGEGSKGYQLSFSPPILFYFVIVGD